jgi:hypothetical protein
MKRFCLAVFLAVGFVTGALPASAQPAPGLAPADRYFGRLKMSILGVRNSLVDLSARVSAHPQDAVAVYEQALLVDDALHDWAAHFPHDTWIPRFAHGLAELYRKVDTEDSRIRMNDTLDWLVATYPQSEYAQRPRT